jgi:hypothetical protein
MRSAKLMLVLLYRLAVAIILILSFFVAVAILRSGIELAVRFSVALVAAGVCGFLWLIRFRVLANRPGLRRDHSGVYETVDALLLAAVVVFAVAVYRTIENL